MARDSRAQNVVALHRFGLAPKPGLLASINDVRSALLAELDDPSAGQIKNDDLLSSGEAARAAFDFRQERKTARLAARSQDNTSKQQIKGDSSSSSAPQISQHDAAPKLNPGVAVPQQIYLEEAKARLDNAFNADVGFIERLVWFWSNHFCVSADKGGVRPLCGAYEREAIRLHVRGKFVDMLLAVESHPAMLLYLDNARSIGLPDCAGTRVLMKISPAKF